jgi:hypothetical protein
MIVFENDGEIDLRAISQFGINVKSGSSPIGFFGTGLKYALAVLMREGQEITIHSGMRTCVISKQADDFRGKSFEFITATTDGVSQMLGFTTELGKNWPMWAAYRELACNCTDEAGNAYETESEPFPVDGKTVIVVKGEAFEKEHFSRGNNILQDEAFISIGGALELRNGQTNHIYYRGVRVHDTPRQTMFRYNILSDLALTEDRICKGSPNYVISKALLGCDDESLLMQVLSANDDWLEHDFDYHGWGATPSTAFLGAVNALMQDKVSIINRSAMQVWRDFTNQKLNMEEIELTRIERQKLDRAIAFVERNGYGVTQYPIKVVEALGSGTLAMAEDDTVFLTRQLLNVGGATKIASCLIEEYLHLKHGFDDCSRAMQTYLFETLVSVYEEKEGEAL